MALDLVNPIIDIGSHGIFGVVQRLAWDASEAEPSTFKKIGFWVTAGMTFGGLLAQSFVRDPMLRRLAGNASNSGATIGGWVMGEQLFLKDTSPGDYKPALRGRAPAGALRGGSFALNGAPAGGPRAMVHLSDEELASF